MASPFYTPINVNQSDFSPITRGAESYGRSVGEGLEKLGAAVGQVASSYFEKKKFESLVDKMADDPMVQEYLQSMGQEFEDKGSKSKFLKEMMNELGGPENFRNHLQTQLKFQASQTATKQVTDLYNLEKRQKEIVVENLEYQNKIKGYTNSYLKHLNTKLDNGTRRMDSDDPTGGFDASDPAALEAVMGVNKQFNLGSHNPALISMMSSSLAPIDETTGQQLPYRNYANEADLYKQTDPLLNGPMGKGMSPEIKAAFIERQKANIDGAGGKKTVRELFTEGINNRGFGAYAEAMKGNAGSMGKLRTMLDTAIVENDDGTIQIKNATAASIALIQMAKNAQGAGVLSDKDVDRISGRQDFGSVLDRFFEKRIGQEMTLTKEMVEENPTWLRAVNPDTGKPFAVGDEVLVGGSEMSIDDLILMREIADGLDNAANNFSQKVIPDIYKDVQATYGGFTIEELNQYTDLHQFMPNGIVNTNPLAMVKQKDMQGLYFMMREEGMTPEEVYSYARSSSIAAGTWDEDSDGPALKMAIKQISEQGWRPKMNQQVMDYNMQGTYDRKQKNVVKPTKGPETASRLRPDEVVTDSDGNLVDAVWAASSTYGALNAAEMFGIYCLYRDLIDKEFVGKNTWKSVQKDISKLKGKALIDNARNFGVEGFDKMSDKQIRAAIKKNIGDEVKKIAAKEMAEMGIKKSLWSKLLVSGGAGAVMFAYDIVDLLGTKDKVTVKAAEDFAKKYPKGSPERKIADEIVDEAKSQFSTITDGLRGIGAGLLEENNVGKNLEARRTAASKATSIRPAKPRNYLQKLLGTYN